MLDVVSIFLNETLQLASPKQPIYIINTIVEESLKVFQIKLENCSINIVTHFVMGAR